MLRPVNGSGLPRAALINDFSCFGKCSLTVSLPILASFGVEAAALPTALLSSHTAEGFGDYFLRDLTAELRAVAAHWKTLSLRFDGICTGFFASLEQLSFARDFIRDFSENAPLVIVDPVLGDGGALYPCFTPAYVGEMRALCALADLITPNCTEAMLLTGLAPDAAPEALLAALPVENAILTGVRRGDEIGYLARLDGEALSFFRPRLPKTLHGTGDVFVSALAGALLGGGEDKRSAFLRAAEFCDASVRATALRGDGHWYALAFEDVLRQERN